jgi:hypothetical protein
MNAVHKKRVASINDKIKGVVELPVHLPDHLIIVNEGYLSMQDEGLTVISIDFLFYWQFDHELSTFTLFCFYP